MSKVGQDNVELSPRAEGILKDINSLPGRVSSYKDSIVQLKPTTAEERILHFDAHLSVIEGLGSKAIRENSPASTIDSLIDVIHESNKAYSKFANEVDKAKLNVNAAKTEAALKGFVLPLSIGGPSNELDSFGLNTDEYKIAMQATKTAILELANKHISKEDYAEEIRKRAQEILKSDPQAFSTEKLEQFDKFIGQGKQIKKPSKLTDPELEAIALATAKSVDSLSNSIIKDTQSVPSIVLVNDVIKQMEKQHKVKFTPERVEKLMKNLVPTLTKLGPEYLEANKAALTKELSDSLRARQTATSKLGSNYTITTKNLKKFASKIDKTHQPKAAALIKAAKVATPEALAEPKPKKLPPPRPPKLPPPRPPKSPVPPKSLVEPRLPKSPVPPPIPKTVTVVAPPEALVAKPTSLKPPPPLPRTVVTVAAPDHAKAIINDSIKQLQMEHKVKFTPEKIATLTKALAPALAKFGPEYMQTHKATLTRELSSSLRSGQGFISQATGTYSISNSELEKITNKMNKASLEVSNNTVKTVIGRMSDSEITGKLNAFAKEAGGKTFDKAPTVEDIAKIRLSNPKKFDQIFNAPKPLSPDLQEKAHNAPTKSTSPRPPAYPPPKPPATKGQGGGHVM